MPHDTYLGDGVYASFDGYQIILDLRGQDSTTRIALDTQAFRGLVEFNHNLKRLAETICPACQKPLIIDNWTSSVQDGELQQLHVSCVERINQEKLREQEETDAP